ncbi:MAG: sensor histidine kinase [Terrisporobacter sp.]
MRLIDYLKDKIMIILLNISGLFILSCFLLLTNNHISNVLIIVISWISIFLIYLLIEYFRRNKYFKDLEELLHKLDKRYLISEVMESSHRLEDKKYREILRRSNKSVIEKINEIEDEKKNYKEFIESWVHEIKLPITTMELICENNKDEARRKIQSELAKVDNSVEMVLFYARAEEVYKDYLVKEINLNCLISETISRNKSYFIQNRMMIEIEDKVVTVCSDKKWLSFIINQILINSVKYKQDDFGKIKIYSEKIKDSVKLYIEDQGIGIKESEVNRIFDKGFTGSNGRENSKSTGIGLYLCKKLCIKLGIDISVESKIDEYTKVILILPKNDYLSKL